MVRAEREAVAQNRHWQLLACWPPLGTVVHGLGSSSGHQQPGNCARSRQLSQPDGHSCTWTNSTLVQTHRRVIWEQLAVGCHVSASPHLPSTCLVTPNLSFPIRPLHHCISLGRSEVGHVKTSAFAWLIILNIRNAFLPQESESSGLD